MVGAAAVLGLLLRVIWAWWASRPPIGLFDPARYLGYAEQIRTGHGMVEGLSGRPSAYYPPGYPWFLGVLSWISHPFTQNLALVVGLVQAVLGALGVVLGAVVVHRLAGSRAAVAAAFGLAVYPNLVMHAGAVLGETLYDTLFLAFLTAVPARLEAGSLTRRRVAAAALLLGLAVLVRPISLAVVPVVLLCWWFGEKKSSRSARRPARALVARCSAVLVVGVLACIVPWTVRNAVRLHEFVPISTNTGDNLCMGHGADASGAFELKHRCDVPYRLTNGPHDEVAGDRAHLRIALRSIADHPDREPWLLWRRFYFTWVQTGDHDALNAVQSYLTDPWMASTTYARLARIADVAYWLTAAFGVAGVVWLLVRPRPGSVLLVASAVVTAIVPLAFFGDARFKVPVMPLLIMAAATFVGAERSSAHAAHARRSEN